jgi:cytochrome c-type biogenesis protein CcmE
MGRRKGAKRPEGPPPSFEREQKRMASTDIKPPEPSHTDGLERRPNRMPVVLLGVTVLGIFIALGFTMFSRSVTYYRTPTEVLAQPGEHVRISGTVVTGSIVTDASAGRVTFDVTDDTTTVTVAYTGPKPDTLQDGGEAVAEGALGPDGVFVADTLFAKCPSKFQAKTGT